MAVNFAAVLQVRDKRTLIVYARAARARIALMEFMKYAKARNVQFTAYMSSSVVRFPEGGHVTFGHTEMEFRGVELDGYMLESPVEKRLGSRPLLTLLATRVR